MEWTKIKNIIILILACVNLFLLSLVAARQVSAARYEEDARTEAVAVLERAGVTFRPEHTPGDMILPPMMVNRDRSWEQTAAEALLGSAEIRDDYDGLRIVYTGGLGDAEFSSDGKFRFDLAAETRRAEGDLVRDAAACLELLGLAAKHVQTEERGDGTAILFQQVWGEVPLFSCGIELVYRDGALRTVVGRALLGTGTPVAGTTLDSTTALIRILAGKNKNGYLFEQVIAMTAGYVDSGGKPVTLTPVWLVETDGGSFYLDGLTGALTQV